MKRLANVRMLSHSQSMGPLATLWRLEPGRHRFVHRVLHAYAYLGSEANKVCYTVRMHFLARFPVFIPDYCPPKMHPAAEAFA